MKLNIYKFFKGIFYSTLITEHFSIPVIDFNRNLLIDNLNQVQMDGLPAPNSMTPNRKSFILYRALFWMEIKFGQFFVNILFNE